MRKGEKRPKIVRVIPNGPGVRLELACGHAEVFRHTIHSYFVGQHFRCETCSEPR